MYSVGVRGEGHSAASAIGDLSQQSVGVVYFGKDIMRDLVAAGAGLYIEGAAKHPIPFKAQGLHQSITSKEYSHKHRHHSGQLPYP